MLMGFGLGGLALGSIVESLIGSLGLLSVFRMLGIAIAIVCVLAALIVKLPDENEEKTLEKLTKAVTPAKAKDIDGIRQRLYYL